MKTVVVCDDDINKDNSYYDPPDHGVLCNHCLACNDCTKRNLYYDQYGDHNSRPYLTGPPIDRSGIILIQTMMCYFDML